jgi:hypothetical protein
MLSTLCVPEFAQIGLHGEESYRLNCKRVHLSKYAHGLTPQITSKSRLPLPFILSFAPDIFQLLMIHWHML